MKCSIIINNFNYGRFLRASIESALMQTVPSEVVVVDDGSSDESKEIVKEYSGRVIAVLKTNGGQGSAFNSGFAASSGDVIVFLDADDLLRSTAVEEIFAAWEEKLVKLHWPLQVVDINLKVMHGTVPPEPGRLTDGCDPMYILQTGKPGSPPTSGNAFSRSFLSELLPMPAEAYRINADAYLVRSAPFRGRVKALENCLGLYRVHGKNAFAGEAQLEVRSPAAMKSFLLQNESNRQLVVAEARRAGYEVPQDYHPRNFRLCRSLILGKKCLPKSVRTWSEPTTKTLVCLALSGLWSSDKRSRLRRTAHSVAIVVIATLPGIFLRRILRWS